MQCRGADPAPAGQLGITVAAAFLQFGYAAAHSIYGAPQNKDIDAFYIPSGTSYYGAYAGIPKKWTHTRSGWWKFANTTDVHIDWTA